MTISDVFANGCREGWEYGWSRVEKILYDYKYKPIKAKKTEVLLEEIALTIIEYTFERELLFWGRGDKRISIKIVKSTAGILDNYYTEIYSGEHKREARKKCMEEIAFKIEIKYPVRRLRLALVIADLTVEEVDEKVEKVATGFLKNIPRSTALGMALGTALGAMAGGKITAFVGAMVGVVAGTIYHLVIGDD